MFDHGHTYWLHRGAAQAHYDEMEAAGWKYTRASEEVFHRYYRFHNDGDATQRIRALLRNLCADALRSNAEYTAYCARWEARVIERVEIEYRRFQRAQLANRPA